MPPTTPTTTASSGLSPIHAAASVPMTTEYVAHVTEATADSAMNRRRENPTAPAVTLTAVRPTGTNRAPSTTDAPRRSSDRVAHSTARRPRAPRRAGRARVPSARPRA
ncbi:Uncharacterised protein [Mycobacteroides abscessus]|nr:Uncharacterised protein [Mycobacteroides abscessus]